MFDAEHLHTPESDPQSQSDGVTQLNPFSVLGGPSSPMRMMFAPFEIAVFLPAYAISAFHGPR